MNKKFASMKEFVKRNERRILITTSVVGIAGTALMVRNQRVVNEFLKEHDLLDEFYTLEEN